MQHLLQAFLLKQYLMVVWLNGVMIVLCQGFCCIKDIRIYIVIWIINNNVGTEITCFHKNMVALQNLVHSEKLAPTIPLRIQSPLIVRSPLSFSNLAPKAIFFLRSSCLELSTRLKNNSNRAGNIRPRFYRNSRWRKTGRTLWFNEYRGPLDALIERYLHVLFYLLN